MRIDKARAARVLMEEAMRAGEVGLESEGQREWEEELHRFSEACRGTSQTHVAFLGTALLAKATTLETDVYAVKARASTPGAYSARGLGHDVLVPNAPRLGIDLGVSGREPLNNQPYFRVLRATEDSLMPLVRDPAPVTALLAVLGRLDKVQTEAEARTALRAFIKVRRGYLSRYPTALTDLEGSRILPRVADFAAEFVGEASEGGRRAQAVAAGILCAVFGREVVEAARVNDPDRHLPGDVGVRYRPGGTWRLVLEVRDKPVSVEDLMLLAQKAAKAGVARAGCLAISSSQRSLDPAEARAWALKHGVVLEVLQSWSAFVDACLYWGPATASPVELVATAIVEAHRHLVEVEASVSAVERWRSITA